MKYRQISELWRHMHQAGKKRRKRYGAYDSRGRLAGKRHISERPAEVESREAIGHWEIDTVMGNDRSRHSVVTIVERAAGYLQIGRLERHTAAETTERCIELVDRDRGRFSTITSDNGTEFHDYKDGEAPRRLAICLFVGTIPSFTPAYAGRSPFITGVRLADLHIA